MRGKVIFFSVILFICAVGVFYASKGVSQQRTTPEAVEDAQAPRSVP